VKCSSCQTELVGDGFVITLVSRDTVYTGTVHSVCLGRLIGHVNIRKLRILAIDAGWRQERLPI
jgi:hypothetical protein